MGEDDKAEESWEKPFEEFLAYTADTDITVRELAERLRKATCHFLAAIKEAEENPDKMQMLFLMDVIGCILTGAIEWDLVKKEVVMSAVDGLHQGLRDTYGLVQKTRNPGYSIYR